MLDGVGITYPQYLVLSTLWECDERSIGGIADALALESSTITPLIKRLVTVGLIHRQRNPQDDRQALVSLTRSRREMQDRCACLPKTLVAACCRSIEDLMTVTHDVRAIRDAVAKHGDAVR